MPAFDKTGPQGKGPMTGRGFGPCNEKNDLKEKQGFGFGRRRGMGRFRGQNENNLSNNK